MTPRAKRITTASSDDDDAPESLTLVASKATARGHEAALQNVAAQKKRKLKEANRQRDLNLKRRAEETRGTTTKTAKLREDMDAGRSVRQGKERRKSTNEGRSKEANAEDRMLRAMEEAGAEDGDVDEDVMQVGTDDFAVPSDFSVEGDEGEPSYDTDEGEEGLSDDMDGERDVRVGGSSEISQGMLKVARKHTKATDSKLDYLPDHLFSAASSSRPSRDSKESSAKPKSSKALLKKKRKQGVSKSKDLIIGSRAIRVQSRPTISSSLSATALTVPPRRVNKFVQENLGLKGKGLGTKHKGWERKPANIGVMRSSGPAPNFARSQL